MCCAGGTFVFDLIVYFCKKKKKIIDKLFISKMNLDIVILVNNSKLYSHLSDDIDWTNPLTGYLKAMTPGIRLNQRLQKTNYDLQMENQRLINQKLKLDFRDGLRSDM